MRGKRPRGPIALGSAKLPLCRPIWGHHRLLLFHHVNYGRATRRPLPGGRDLHGMDQQNKRRNNRLASLKRHRAHQRRQFWVLLGDELDPSLLLDRPNGARIFNEAGRSLSSSLEDG